MLTEKRRQHHVWRRYLESWSGACSVFCLMAGRVFTNATHNLAVESYFYKLEELTPGDLALYRKMLVEKGDERQRASHERFLQLLLRPIEMADRIKELKP